MTEYPERQVSRSAGWSRRVGAFSLVLLLTGWTGHHFGLTETPAFLWVLALAALLAALALLLAGLAFSRLWKFGDEGGRDLTVGALLAALVLVPYGFVAWRVATLPALHDISTDQDVPPAFDLSARMAGMNVPVPPTREKFRLQGRLPLVTGHRYDLPLGRSPRCRGDRGEGAGLAGHRPLPAGRRAGQVTITALAADRADLPWTWRSASRPREFDAGRPCARPRATAA